MTTYGAGELSAVATRGSVEWTSTAKERRANANKIKNKQNGWQVAAKKENVYTYKSGEKSRCDVKKNNMGALQKSQNKIE